MAQTPFSDRRSVRWTCNPGEKTWGYYFQLVPRQRALRLDVQINGIRVPAKLFLGAGRTSPSSIPWAGDLMDSLSGPVIDKRFKPPAEGVYLVHHRGRTAASVPSQSMPLDEKTLKQLKTLGYLR